MPKTYCMSDIHGCILQFTALLKKLDLKPDDTLILMGDYVDRGPDSKAVIDKIIELKSFCNVIALKGNHEAMMYDALKSNSDHAVSMWVSNGGYQTIQSYENYEDIIKEDAVLPQSLIKHLVFIESLDLYYETDTHIFVHASPGLNVPVGEQREAHLIWRRPQYSDEEFGYNHISGKTIVSGHTAQSSGVPKFLSPKNILIDTGCFFTGILTAYNVTDNEFITSS